MSDKIDITGITVHEADPNVSPEEACKRVRDAMARVDLRTQAADAEEIWRAVQLAKAYLAGDELAGRRHVADFARALVKLAEAKSR